MEQSFKNILNLVLSTSEGVITSFRLRNKIFRRVELEELAKAYDGQVVLLKGDELFGFDKDDPEQLKKAVEIYKTGGIGLVFGQSYKADPNTEEVNYFASLAE